jgi:hypothetical protein
MDAQALEQIRAGMTVYEPDGTPVGTVVAVHLEPPQGPMAPGMGYLEIDEQRPDRTKHLHLPLTEVRAVRPDGVVVELDPDIVAQHNAQWFPTHPLKQR